MAIVNEECIDDIGLEVFEHLLNKSGSFTVITSHFWWFRLHATLYKLAYASRESLFISNIYGVITLLLEILIRE